MGKPFDRDLARASEVKTRELVYRLNRSLSRFEARPGPLKNHDISLVCRANRDVEAFVEVVRSDRWRRIRVEFPTVRWPIAKKEKCEEYMKKGSLLIMMSVNEDLTEMFFIECDEWVNGGREEKAPAVRAGGKLYRYRKGGEERFWAIDKNRVVWCKVGECRQLEEYIVEMLKSRGVQC